jgi:hypothetical protein
VLKMVEENPGPRSRIVRPIGHQKSTFKSVDSDQFQIGPRRLSLFARLAGWNARCSPWPLAWIEDPSLRRRVTAGLNKGEARNSLFTCEGRLLRNRLVKHRVLHETVTIIFRENISA